MKIILEIPKIPLALFTALLITLFVILLMISFPVFFLALMFFIVLLMIITYDLENEKEEEK